jgi:hypothetical protein
MLTRCKAGMIIVTNRRFVRVQARQTLVGKLADHWARQAGSEDVLWTDWVRVQEGTVDMPGSPGCDVPQRHDTPPPVSYQRFPTVSILQILTSLRLAT